MSKFNVGYGTSIAVAAREEQKKHPNINDETAVSLAFALELDAGRLTVPDLLVLLGTSMVQHPDWNPLSRFDKEGA